MTIHELIKAFISDADINEVSRKNYIAWLRQFQKYIVEKGLHIESITKENIINYKFSMLGSKADKTINCYLTAIRMFYNWMELNDYSKNITLGIRMVRIKVPYRKHALTTQQVITLINSCDSNAIGNRNKVIIELMLATGLRSIEVSRLQKQDHINNTLTIQGKGSTSKDTVISIPEDISHLLKIQATNPSSTYIFHTDTGKQLRSMYISQLINQQMEHAGIKSNEITCHSLRHTAAINYFNETNDIVKTKIFMRHGSIRTTEIYLQSITHDNKVNDTTVCKIRNKLIADIKQAETANKVSMY